MLTKELAELLGRYAETAESDWQLPLDEAARRLAVCASCAYCVHATRAGR